MPPADEPARALRRLLRTDADLAGEPRRLGRALLDLLPHDDRSVRLLVSAAELGVPALVGDGRLAEARRALTEEAGFRPDLAAWAVDVWRSAADDDTAAGFDPVRLAAWPDGTLLVVTREDRGVFGALVGASGPFPWRMLAHRAGAGSVAVSADGGRLVVAWPQVDGVNACEAHRHDGALVTDPPEPVAEARPGLTPAAPFAFVTIDETLSQFVWSTDGGRMHRGTWRAWPSDDPDEDLPPVGAPVTGLDASRPSPGTALLTATTADGRVLTARWDLPGEHVASWQEVARPGPGGTDWLATVTAGTIVLSRPGSDAIWSLRVP